MDVSQGLICAFQLDGRGGGSPLDWEGVRKWQPGEGILWVHLDYSDPHAERWIEEESGLTPLVAEALLAEETRPRSLAMRDGLLVTLRGVNMNPGAEPEDMVSIRVWVNDQHIITTRNRPLLSIDDMRRAIAQGEGPCTPGEFLTDLADRLVARMADVIDTIDERVGEVEAHILEADSHQMRGVIAHIRREAIMLRRYLAPQREAVSRLASERVPWLDDMDRMRLREAGDRTTRYVEDLDSARERAAVAQEELMSRLSEQMDRRMYVLSIVAAIFLPLGFLTGLLGINVGGIPGAEYKGAFIVFVVMLVILVGVQLWLLRSKRWL